MKIWSVSLEELSKSEVHISPISKSQAQVGYCFKCKYIFEHIANLLFLLVIIISYSLPSLEEYHVTANKFTLST